jgi:tetratricopeptide (TPR) repeat protein
MIMAALWTTCARCKLVFQTDGPARSLCLNCARQGQSQASTVAEPAWFYAQNKEKHGPVPRDELHRLAAAGRLKPTDMVLQDGTKTWIPASSVAGLFGTTVAETVDDPRRTTPHAAPVAAPVAPPLPAVPGYEILGVLGRGGMGVVYKVRQVQLKRVVALKMILAGAQAGAAELARFRTEAEAVARLQHPNIVQIHDVGEYEGRPYFSLEFVEGGTLAKKLAGAPQPPREAAQLVHTLALAMDAAHQRGIVHRDLKPANVLLAGAADAPVAQCVPKIADFGLAKRLDDDSGQTQTGAIMGTPSYMAPEQASGQVGAIGPAADVYALGAILYELLTGRPPFRGATMLDTLEQVRQREPVPPRELQPKTPRDLETICLKCLAKEPGKRYASAKELADDLDRFLNDKPILARPAGAVERAVKFARRNKILVAGVAAVITVLGVGIVTTSAGMVAAWVQTSRANTATKKEHQQQLLTREETAKLAEQRGLVKDALNAYTDLLREDHPDPTRLRIGRARALLDLNQVAEAKKELDALAKRPDLGKHEGSVLILRAELALDTESKEGLELFRQALTKDLTEGERFFAKALLASKTADTADLLRKAVAADPYHVRSRMLLAVTLLVLGRTREMEDVALASGALFPENPNFKVLQAMARALAGDVAGAGRNLDQTRGQLDAEEIKALKGAMEILAKLANWGGDLDAKAYAELLLAWKKLKPLAVRFVPESADVADFQSAVHANNQLRLPPLVERIVVGLSRSLVKSIQDNDLDGAVIQIEDTLKVNPEGTLYHFLGMLLLARGRFQESEQAFLKALETPAFMNVRARSLYFAAYSVRGIVDRDPNAGAEVYQRGVRYVEQRYRAGPVTSAEAPILVDMAILGRAYDLARAILADWEKLPDADRTQVVRQRAAVELFAGNFTAAVAAADEVLAKNPNDQDIKKLRANALQRLKTFLAERGP